MLDHIDGGGTWGPEENSYCIELGFGRVIDIENIESVIIGQEYTEILIK